MSKAITLTGSNFYQLNDELLRLKTKFVQKYGDINIENLDEETEVDTLISSVQALPFLAEKRLLIVKNLGAKKALAERIDEVLDNVSEATELVIVEPKIDKRFSYYKTLKTKTVFREFGELNEPQLISWLIDAAKQQNGSLSRTDAGYLVQRVGPNQQLLAQELSKLLLYNPNISRTSIDELVEPTPQSSVFELLDAAFQGQTKKVVALYEEQRAMKVEPLNILAMIAWQLHALAIVKTAGKRSDAEIAQAASLNPFVVRKSQTIAKSLALSRLKQLIAETLALDTRLKSESIDPDEAMLQLLLSIAG